MHLELEVLSLRTRHAFNIARAVAPPVRRNVWIRARDEDGHEGWGEAAVSLYLGETAETVAAVLPRLAEALGAAGVEPFALEAADAAIEGAISHHSAAKAGVSAALHDLVGKRLGLPVWKLWGLRPEAAPASSFTIGIDEPAVLRRKVQEAAEFTILKIKLGTDQDEQILRTVREEAPTATLRVDANTAWTLPQAVRNLPMLIEYGVELLEQPFAAADIDSFRRLRRQCPLPLIADESCRTATDVVRLVGAVDGVNIKLAKCGSLREAVRMVHVARAHGMQVMLGCMVESTLGIAAAVQLAPLTDYVDLDGAALLADDPFTGPGLEPGGRLRFNHEPGLGVTRA